MRRYEVTVLALAASLFGVPAFAQDAVARITAVKGKVNVRHGDNGSWVPARVNTALATDDVIATEAGARVDIQLDALNALRLAGSGEIIVTRAEYERYELALVRGGIVYRVLGPSQAISSIETPSISVAPNQEAVIRIEVTRAGESEIQPEQGKVLVYAPTGSMWVSGGEKLVARGDKTNPEFRVRNRLRVWRQVAQILGNIQMAADIGGSGGSEGSSRKAENKSDSLTNSKNSGETARATPHPTRAPEVGAKSSRNESSTHVSGGGHTGGSSRGSSGGSSGGGHGSSSGSSSSSSSSSSAKGK